MADSTADDCNVQDKGHIDEELDRKENVEKIVKTDVTKANTKRSNKRVNVADVVSRLDLKATGVRSSDLAKHDQPFFIHSQDHDSYVKFKTSKADLGHVETSKNWASGNGLFALEDAGSGKYYIKAMSNAKSVVGYLFLSDKTTGAFSKTNNIMWSKEKQDQPNYKFEFEQRGWPRNSQRIACNGRTLLTTTGEKGHLRANKEYYDTYTERCFELNMPPEIDVEITKGEQCFNGFHMLVRHWMDRKICNNATDGEMVINHDIFAEMNGYGIRVSSAQPIGVSDQIIERRYAMTVPPKRKGLSSNILTAEEDKIEEEMHIKIRGTEKEFVGYKVRVDQPGTIEVIHQLEALDEEEDGTFSVHQTMPI